MGQVDYEGRNTKERGVDFIIPDSINAGRPKFNCPDCNNVMTSLGNMWRCIDCGRYVGKRTKNPKPLKPTPVCSFRCPDCGNKMTSLGNMWWCFDCGRHVGKATKEIRKKK